MMTRSVRILVCIVLFFVSIGPSSAAGPGPTNGAPHKSYLPLLRDELQPVIPETTEALTDTTTQYLSAVSPDGVVYAFSAVTPELAELDPGDVMVGGVSAAAPYGFLRRVTSVASVGSGLQVSTEPATLGDAIEQGDAYFSQELSPEDLRDVVWPEGVTLATPMGSKNFHFNIVNVVLYDHDGDHETTDDQIRANGALDLLLGFDFSFRIKGGQLKTLDFIGRVNETADLQVGAHVQIGALYEEFSLTPPVTLSAITFPIGPIPVVITPVLSIFIGMDGNAHVGVTASVTQQAGLSGGLRYANGSWSPVAERTNDFLFDPPHAYASLNLRAFGGARLAVLLYGVTGPYMTIDLYLALRVDPFAGNWIDLYGGLKWFVGVRVEIFGRTLLDSNRTLANFERHLFRDSLRPPPTFTPTPTATPTATPPPPRR